MIKHLPLRLPRITLVALLVMAGCADEGEVLTNTPPAHAGFQKDVLESKKLVVVDFGAKWCGPCQQQTPILDRLSIELASQVSVVKYDVDEENKLADHYKISDIPALLFFKNGKMVANRTGLHSLKDLKQLVDKFSNVP